MFRGTPDAVFAAEGQLNNIRTVFIHRKNFRLLSCACHEIDSAVKREIEFLKWICTDLTYKEIADKMFVSPRTVDGYRDDLFQKLNIKSRVGLAMYAIKNGIVKV